MANSKKIAWVSTALSCVTPLIPPIPLIQDFLTLRIGYHSEDADAA